MASVQEKAMCVLWFSEAKSFIKMQRRYRTQYGKYLTSHNAIRRWLKLRIVAENETANAGGYLEGN
jgi:hypothetical protein